MKSVVTHFSRVGLSSLLFLATLSQLSAQDVSRETLTQLRLGSMKRTTDEEAGLVRGLSARVFIASASQATGQLVDPLNPNNVIFESQNNESVIQADQSNADPTLHSQLGETSKSEGMLLASMFLGDFRGNASEVTGQTATSNQSIDVGSTGSMGSNQGTTTASVQGVVGTNLGAGSISVVNLFLNP